MKYALILIIGIIIGLAIIPAVNYVQGPSSTSLAQNQNTTMTPTTTGDPSPTLNPTEKQQELNKLRNRLYQEGVTVKASVEKVYPGIGFIATDNAGTRVFVHWTKGGVNEGENVVVNGPIKQISQNIDQLRKESGYTSDLNNFLSGQQIYLEAKSVTPEK